MVAMVILHSHFSGSKYSLYSNTLLTNFCCSKNADTEKAAFRCTCSTSPDRPHPCIPTKAANHVQYGCSSLITTLFSSVALFSKTAEHTTEVWEGEVAAATVDGDKAV